MSDFLHSGWALFVAVVTALSLLACLALLAIAAKRRVMSDDNTTGHVWDEDLKEMNNPLPRWWMGLFVITVVFAAVYLAFYPGMGSAPGLLKWTSVGQYEAEQAKARDSMASVYARFVAMNADQLVADEQAMGIGQRLYLNNCAMCHGSDARGAKGFPNLADNDWLGGNDLGYVKKTIVEGRVGAMPAMAAAVGTAEDVKNLAHYVLSLSGSAHNSIAAQLGKPKFATCAACHGPEGKGNQALGAPNLSDKIWLHGGGLQSVVSMINGGKDNMMPAWNTKLTEGQIHVLASYVLGLSQRAPASASK